MRRYREVTGGIKGLRRPQAQDIDILRLLITNLQAESNCLENIYRYKQASLYFSFIYCTCACKHLKFTYPFRHLKTFIPSHHQLSQKKVIFSPQKKKKKSKTCCHGNWEYRLVSCSHDGSNIILELHLITLLAY